VTPSGRHACGPHVARLRPGSAELVLDRDVWEELERRGVAVAVVRFAGHAGRGGDVEAAVLSRVVDGALVEERRLVRDELDYALAGPAWGRYGAFAGQPPISATLTWTASDRGIVIAGRRGGEAFTEVIA
jgi:hypothetical protein